MKIIPITNKKVKDKTGQKFGMLYVVGYVGTIENKHYKQAAFWCKCDCGNERAVVGSQLSSGNARSCGCMQKTGHEPTQIKPMHGLSKHHLYKRWYAMINRCYNEKNDDYYNYGARGIAVCDRWICGPQGFLNFLSDMPGFSKEDGHTIDRINVNGDYSPENCRWATQRMQQNNRKDNRFVIMDGQKMTIAEAARIKGVNPTGLRMKIIRGTCKDVFFIEKNATRGR